MTETEVAVVGAGIAGLACATELAERGVDVVALEARERPGGPVDSVRAGDFLVERGPSTVRGTAELDALARRAGVALIRGRGLAPSLVCDGELLSMPPPLGALLRGRPLPLSALTAAVGEPLRGAAPGPKTVHAFVAERLGRTLADRLADVLTLGVYGTPATEVGFEAAFPDLARELGRGSLARLALGRLLRRGGTEPRRGLVSTARGLGALVDGLAASAGPRLRLAAPVRRISRHPGGGYQLALPGDTIRCRSLVVTAGPRELARLVDSAAVARVTAGYRPTPQTLASFALEDAACRDRWQTFGFLVPTRERLPLIGCLVPSAVFPDRAPAGAMLLTAFTAPELRDAPDAEIAATLAPLLQRLLGARAAPTLLDVARHPAGIWLYDRRHPHRTAVLRGRLAAELGPGVHLAGAAYTGVAFGSAAAAGLRAAEALAAPA